jgi:hypothetical protein
MNARATVEKINKSAHTTAETAENVANLLHISLLHCFLLLNKKRVENVERVENVVDEHHNDNSIVELVIPLFTEEEKLPCVASSSSW